MRYKYNIITCVCVLPGVAWERGDCTLVSRPADIGIVRVHSPPHQLGVELHKQKTACPANLDLQI